MNRQLRRIEQTLQQLDQTAARQQVSDASDGADQAGPNSTAASIPSLISHRSSIETIEQMELPTPSVSFQLTKPLSAVATAATKAPPVERASQAEAAPTITNASPVQPLIVEGVEAADMGDKFKLPDFTGNLGFSRHQNGSNPDLALNVLSETLNLLQSWREELQQVVRAIQEIYREGPIVDGWLECSTHRVEATTQVLRTAEVSHLMGYVESLCDDPTAAQPEYRLCGMSSDGRVWSSPCPQSQLASISLAISRHQKLQPLRQRKLVLEKQLSQAAEITAKVHSQVQAL